MRAILQTILLAFILTHSAVAQPQVIKPVKWKVTAQTLGNSQYNLVFEASIDPGWYLYSMELPEGGPIPTAFNFEELAGLKLVGNTKPNAAPKIEFDQIFEMEVGYYSGFAKFTQTLELEKGSSGGIVSGYIDYQACFEDKCIFQDQDFSITIGDPKQQAKVTELAELADPTQLKPQVSIEAAQTEQQPQTTPDRGLLIFFLISFAAGLAGLLTPCVFPMIPLTVSYFMGKQGSRLNALVNALVFGLSIVAIYTAIGALVSLTSLGAGFANQLVSHWLPNSIFFLLFMAFAASFFGVFEIRLPSSLSTKADSQADRGGLVGSFFMALTMVIVSLSCVGPIVGALLVEAATGEGIQPIIGMFGFSLAFAIPFTLFAIFPSWLKKLPKSGGWLNSVKVVLGFIVLAFGLKFLDTIDRAYHINILGREIYLAIWIAIFIMLGLYLLGKIRFKFDSPTDSIGFGRLLLAIASFSFVIYLIPGMFGAPLAPLSGLIPPKAGHSFDLMRSPTPPQRTSANLCDKPKYADILSLPHGLQGYFHYQQALECARELDKPLFIDFVGHACANCKVMEQRVWSDPRVLQRLRDNFVIVALYVDERTPLPEDEWVTSTVDGRVKNTLGRLNADIQISKFGINGQPYYVIVDGDENLLAEPYGYNLDVEAFIEFLDGVME